MPERTSLFKQLPWVGGVNTSTNEAMIGPSELTVADNVVFGSNGARRKREGINNDYDSGSADTDPLVGGIDTHLGTSSKTQRLLAVSDAGQFYEYNGGTRTSLTDAGTAWASPTIAVFTIIGNIVVGACDGASTVLKKWTGTGQNVVNLGGTPPNGTFVVEHLGRIWTNDPSTPDRLHYSSTGNPEQWNGAGDSGAIDIRPGDGDVVGLVGAAKFKGELFVWKDTHLYRVSGYTPETFQITDVSDKIGLVSPAAITSLDQDDVLFVSKRGVHSLAATDKYGDFEQAYVSLNIQPTFNSNWSASRLQYIHAAYLPSINSVGFLVTDTSLASNTANNCIWWYNTILKIWYRWKNISAASIFIGNDSDKQRLYLGGNNERLFQTQIGNVNDVNDAGVSTAIPYGVSTGIIFPEGEPFVEVAFKSFILYYQKEGSHLITVNLTIDNFATQTRTFSQEASGDLLGSTFIMGESFYGTAPVFAAHTVDIDGHGKGIKIEIFSDGTTTENVEIQGFGLEYETAGIEKEQDSGEE